MRESKVWGMPVAVFTPLLLALLVAAAFRQMQSAATPEGAVFSDVLDLPATSNPDPKSNSEPEDDAAPSNDISDYPQLD